MSKIGQEVINQDEMEQDMEEFADFCANPEQYGKTETENIWDYCNKEKNNE